MKKVLDTYSSKNDICASEKMVTTIVTTIKLIDFVPGSRHQN